MCHLPRGVYGDVDPAPFKQADMGPMQLAGFGEALLRETNLAGFWGTTDRLQWFALCERR